MATLTTYRRVLAPYLGDYQRGTATAGVANTTTRLECTTASHTGLRFRSSVRGRLFKDKWLHRPDAVLADDRDRLIATDTPSSGYLDPDDPWTNAPTSEAFETLGIFSGTQLTFLVNEALKRCWDTREVTFTVADTITRQHNLTTTIPWLKRHQWVYQVGHLGTGQDRTQYNPFDYFERGTAYTRSGSVYVEGFGLNTTDTGYVLAVCPSHALCRADGGDYGDQSGLSLETDEAPADEYWVAQMAVTVAFDHLDHLLGDDTDKKAQARRALWAARATLGTAQNFVPPERTFVPVYSMGPR